MTEYKVTIERIDRDVPFKNREYQIIGTDKSSGENKYGYVEFDDIHTVTKEIFNQTVDELDISKVVLVINGED